MKYRPYWQRIFFLAIVFNLILFFSGAKIFSTTEIKETPPEDLIEIEWIETAETVETAPAQEISAAETFSEIVLPPLEIPHTIFEPLPKLEIEPPKEIPKFEEVKPAETEEIEKPAEKKVENLADKLKVIVKVLPKDIIEQFILSGISETKFKWNGEKIILAVTIGIDGKVKPNSVEIRIGSTGEMIDLVAKTAASSWIFEPYLDENGNPQELKTQMEFTREDF